MGSGPTVYNETNDLYLQMLSEARRLEDKRLARMILRRILDGQQAVDNAAPLFNNIVVLPLTAAPSGPVESEMPFWSEKRFWQELIQFLVPLSAGMYWLLYFFYLIVTAKAA